MFLDFYQLQEQPFGVTPDPRYLYLGASHREALASLQYGIKTGRGLLALIAPPGMGKTTLLFRLLEHLRRSARTVFLFQTQCDSAGLLRYLLTDLGVDTRELDFVSMHEQLNQLLLREKSAGRRFVLVIDEAQNLDNSVLETARLLSDFETPSEKLLQIVLAGQEQLAEKLQKPELAQLRQRIAIVGRLEPLTAPEVIDYIGTRLMVAGYKAGRVFTPAALNRIAESSRGIPRNINNVCFNAMSLGCALGRKQIDIELVDQATADLDVSSVAGKPRREPPAVVRLALARPAAPAHVPGVPVSIFRAAERKSRFGSVAGIASVIVLSLLAAALYRQDIRIAAAQTRRTLVVAAASLSSHHTAEKAVPDATTTAWKQASGEKPLALTNRNSAITTASPAATNSILAMHTGASDLAGDEERARMAVAAHKQQTSPQVEFAGGATVVVVQPHDDLRQICLHSLGSYSARLVSKISKLNPELTDPDRIAIGQRIVLPGSANVGANVSRSSVSRP